jgi:hypothetical protein
VESGIYIRVGKDNLLLEEMSEEQRIEWLNSLEKDGLIRTINRLCDCLKQYENNADDPDYDEPRILIKTNVK